MQSELAIRGGMVVDGTGQAPYRADVGVTDGRITAIDATVTGTQEIDASGRFVCPGFIDIHTHYDPQVLWDPMLSSSCWHGVTSVVAGNCGYSIAPARSDTHGPLLRTLDKVEDMRLATLEAGVEWNFETYGDYLDAIAARGTALNFGGYVGHTAVRLYVMGDDGYEREATEEEVDRMRAVVADSIRAGALGFSSDRGGFHRGDGGRPVPSIIASQREVEALMHVPTEIGQGIVHVAPGENFPWVYEVAPTLGRPLTWSAILTYPPGPARAPYSDKLARHAAGRAGGADVWPQVTCRPIVQDFVMSQPNSFYPLPAFSQLVPMTVAERARAYADPAWRAAAWEQLDSGKWVNPRWQTFVVAESDHHPELIGRSLAEIAAERGCTCVDVACDVALADDLATRFNITFANDDVDGVTELLTSEGCIMGLSDAGAHVGQICDAVMPTDFLSNWVRDREVMPVETGVRKLTGELADVFHLERGYLRAGAPADVVVLDLDRVSTGPLRRVHDMPAGGERLIADAPEGIDYVLVNGVVIRDDGKDVAGGLDRLPGQILRSRP